MVQSVPQTSQDVQILPVDIERGETLFHATSEALPGLLVSERDLDALTQAIPHVVKLMYRAKWGESGGNVEVLRAQPDPTTSVSKSRENWVIVPCDPEGHILREKKIS